MTTARTIITNALNKLAVTSANSVPTDDEMDLGLEALNALIDSKSTEFLNIHTVRQKFFLFTAGKLNYSLGPTGDWVTERPMRLEKVNLLLNPIIDYPPPAIQYIDYTWWPDTPINPGSVVKTFNELNDVVEISVIPNSTNAGMRTPTAIEGKVYCEFELLSKSSNNTYQAFGIVEAAGDGFTPSPYATYGYNITSRYPTLTAQCGYSAPDLLSNGGVETYATKYAFGPGDRIGIAIDNDTGQIWYSKNGTWIDGDPVTGEGESATFPMGEYFFTTTVYTCNAGGGTSYSAQIFPGVDQQTYGAPEGFVPYYNPGPTEVIISYDKNTLFLPITQVQDEEFSAIRLRGVSNTIPTKVLDQGGYPNRNLQFWPIPNSSNVAVELWMWEPLNIYDIDEQLNLPKGYERYYTYALAIELADTFSKSLTPEIVNSFREAEAEIKTLNQIDFIAQPSDEALELSRFGRPYNIIDFYAGAIMLPRNDR